MGMTLPQTKYTVGFESFWRVWRQVTEDPSGKKPAFLSWQKQKLEGNEVELIARLAKQAKYRKWYKWKYPKEFLASWRKCVTWLNQQGWEDEAEIPKSAPVRTGKPESLGEIIVASLEERQKIAKEAGWK